jgi:hypothetical protein
MTTNEIPRGEASGTQPSQHEQLISAAAEIAQTPGLWQVPDKTSGWYLCDINGQTLKDVFTTYDAQPSYEYEPETDKDGAAVPGTVSEIFTRPALWDTALPYPLPDKLRARERVDFRVAVTPDGAVHVRINSEGKDPSMAIYTERGLARALGSIRSDAYKRLAVTDTYSPDGTIVRADETEFDSDALDTLPHVTEAYIDPTIIGDEALMAVATRLKLLQTTTQGLREGTVRHHQPYAYRPNQA